MLGCGLAIVVVVAVAVSRFSAGTDGAAIASEPPSSTSASVPTSEDLGAAFGTTSDQRSVACGGVALECTMLTVPADHTDAESEITVDVRFGLHPASDRHERLGTLVILTGGPGSSGIADSQLYLDTFAPGVVDRYDMVFLEQRGIGKSIPALCREAEAEAPDWIDEAISDLASAQETTRRWVGACLAEAKIDSGTLGRFATYQSAADLDAYLDAIGADDVILFGESYGTVLAQLYAAQRPERVSALILDAPVDGSLGGVEQAVEQAAAFSDVLDLVLDECTAEAACVDDFSGGDPAASWDALAERLREGSVEVELPSRNGRAVAVEFSRRDLLTATAAMLYSEWERVHLLRALAAASRDDLGPFVRMAALTRGLDPETASPLPATDPWLAAYYAIGCQDFDPSTDSVEELVERIGRLEGDAARLAELAHDALPCFAGFSDPNPVSVEARLPDVPILVLTATADPATPTAWAEALVNRATTAHLIVTEGGGHGNYGWGLPCADDPVRDLLTFGDLPSGTETTCEGYVLDYYTPLPLAHPDEYPDLLDALFAVQDEIWMLPDYLLWDGTTRRVGCPHGGWIEMAYAGQGEKFELRDCRVLADWPLTGRIRYGDDFTTSMELTVPGGQLEYAMDDQGRATLNGTIDAAVIKLSR